MTTAELTRIATALQRRHIPGSPEQLTYDRAWAKWSAILKSKVEAIRASERLAAEDFAIRFHSID